MIQFKRGTTTGWSNVTKGVLSQGQPGIEYRGSKSPRMKVGTPNETKWDLLPYLTPDVDIYTDNGIMAIGSEFILNVKYNGTTTSSLSFKATNEVDSSPSVYLVQIKGVSSPSENFDAVNKKYVDNKFESVANFLATL